MKIQRRQLLKSLGALSLTAPTLGALTACSARVGEDAKAIPLPPAAPPEPAITPSVAYSDGKVFKPGYLSIIQGPTSDTTAMINLFIPKLKKYFFEVSDAQGNQYPVERLKRVEGPTHWHVVKLKVTGLTPNVQYTLNIFDNSRSGEKSSLIDQRFFQSLDIHKSNPRFGFLSCMADDIRFDQVIDPMWNRLQAQDVDFLCLTGDLVYVDSFENVERLKATEFDIWQRYVDSLRRLPVYHWTNLKPIFATWDDHDYGTNDGDRDFIGRDNADKLFHALFFGDNIDGVWSLGPKGTSGIFKAYGQKFILLDDRSFRQPNKNQATQEPYGHWGEAQHKWLMANLSEDKTPAWIFNGNQFFRGAPDNVTYVESLAYNHKAEYRNFCEGLKNIDAPVVFGSGDVHLSEVMQIPAETIGFQSYEFTSSSMHSYVGDDAWANSLRVEGMACVEFNFMVIQSQAIARNDQRGLTIQMQSIGLAKKPYFERSFEVLR